MSEQVIKKMNRREFLAYMMAGSIGLLGIQGAGIALWYATPTDYKQDIFFIEDMPDSLYRDIPAHIFTDTTRISTIFWLSYSPNGLVALHRRCPFLEGHCYYAWVNNNKRFECPCCGSKFERDGTVIEGISPRRLDRYAMKVITRNRTYETNEVGDPIQVSLSSIEEIHVNVGKLIVGKYRI